MPLSERGQTWLIIALRLFGFMVGGVTTALGFYVLISGRDSAIRDVVLDIYRIVFGALIMVAELRLKRLLVWFSFLLYYVGLGLFYVFLGGLAGGNEWYEWIIAIVAVAVGVTYCAVGCMCSDVERRQHSAIRDDVAKAQM